MAKKNRAQHIDTHTHGRNFPIQQGGYGLANLGWEGGGGGRGDGRGRAVKSRYFFEILNSSEKFFRQICC